MDTQSVYILSGIISLVFLACFFVLCYNVGEIKLRFGKRFDYGLNDVTKNLEDVFVEYKMGNYQQAYDVFMREFYAELFRNDGLSKNRIKAWKKLLEVYNFEEKGIKVLDIDNINKDIN